MEKTYIMRSFMICTAHKILGGIKSRRMGWARHVARVGETRGVYRILVGKPERKGPLGRPRRKRGDNIKMGFEEVGLRLRIGAGGRLL
jgi:hypothetical protein